VLVHLCAVKSLLLYSKYEQMGKNEAGVN